MQATARLRFVRSSPRKMRIVADVVRGKKAQEAVNTLQFMPHKAARHILKTVESALKNLEEKAEAQKQRVDDQTVVISAIFVDQAATIRRFQPVSRGRAHGIKKRSSHLTVVVSQPGLDA